MTVLRCRGRDPPSSDVTAGSVASGRPHMTPSGTPAARPCGLMMCWDLGGRRQRLMPPASSAPPAAVTALGSCGESVVGRPAPSAWPAERVGAAARPLWGSGARACARRDVTAGSARTLSPEGQAAVDSDTRTVVSSDPRAPLHLLLPAGATRAQASVPTPQSLGSGRSFPMRPRSLGGGGPGD